MKRTLANRHELLEELLEEPRTKPELVDRVSVSRSTVDRAVDDLLETGCVEKEGSAFGVTEAGRLALRERIEYRTHLETIERAMPVLEGVPPGSIDPCFLRGATVEVPDPQAPWTVFDESAELAKRSHAMFGTAPTVFRRFFRDLKAAVEHGGLEYEIVVDETLFESFSEDDRERLKRIIEPNGGRVLVTELTDPFAVWFMDTGDGLHAGITVYDTGGVKGMIRNDDPAAVEWARAQYRARKRGATYVWDFR